MVEHPVYIDHARIPYRGMRMSHMLVADVQHLESLHAMAEAIGMRREWFQADASTPHYDVAEGRRRMAIKLGAISADRYEIVRAITSFRASKRREAIRNA